MLRKAVISAFFVVALQVALGQTISHGVPASALSPSPDGRTQGVPASALSPTAPPFGINQPFGINRTHATFVSIPNARPHRFGTTHNRHGFTNVVPVFYPVYYGGYNYGYPSVADSNVADPNVEQTSDPSTAQADDSVARSEDALRLAYLQGQRDAMAKELEDTRRNLQNARAAAASPKASEAPQASAEEKKPETSFPPTVFIFKDGHQIETKNFAIMGETLYDISSGVVKKVQLTDLDTAATIKANDDRGITVKLP